jgi:hypothetical protein
MAITVLTAREPHCLGRPLMMFTLLSTQKHIVFMQRLDASHILLRHSHIPGYTWRFN